MTISSAFLVCAGLGTRMRPLTDTCPKPLLPLNGRPLLDYIFDELRGTSVKNVTINSHHLPEQISAYIRSIKDFVVHESYEPVLLETGGGLVQALPNLENNPFYMVNGDAFWINQSGHSVFKELEDEYDDSEMDILLCLTPVSKMKLTEGVGDYDILPDGRLRRSPDKKGSHMFTGIRIVHPRIMDGYKAEKFSFLKNMDEAEAKGRLYGYVLNGDWHHISTPEDLNRVESHLVEHTTKD